VVKKMKERDPRVMDKVLAVGNLYTQERGLDFFVRNLLANPKISRVIITGRDKTGAGEALRGLLQGLAVELKDGCWRLNMYPKVKIRGDIRVEALEEIRHKTIWVRWAGESPESVVEILRDPERGMMRHLDWKFPPPEPEVSTFPTNEHGHVIRGSDIPTVYLDMLHEILMFGRVDDTHYDQEQKELLDLMTVITAQDPNINTLEIPPFIPFDKTHLGQYDLQLNSPEKDPNLTYSYGNRIRAYFKEEGSERPVDQFKAVAAKLLAERESRSAVMSLWDPTREGIGKVKGSPCLNHLWFRIRDVGEEVPALHLTAVIRSNDMFTGWPENAYGLRMLQERMRVYYLCARGDFQDDSGLLLGDLVILSESAHLYKDCWEAAQEIVDGHRKKDMVWDRKGNWIINLDEGKKEVVAQLVDPKGFEVWRIQSPSVAYIRREITRLNLVSDIGHAMFLGSELRRVHDVLMRL
jgi:thymidylate synthase